MLLAKTRINGNLSPAFLSMVVNRKVTYFELKHILDYDFAQLAKNMAIPMHFSPGLLCNWLAILTNWTVCKKERKKERKKEKIAILLVSQYSDWSKLCDFS